MGGLHYRVDSEEPCSQHRQVHTGPRHGQDISRLGPGRGALPNASFAGFTGTPIELQDANTRAVFGGYISIYDIQRSVEDGATVPIHYESRLARLELDESEWPTIDPDFEEATEGEEVERKERLKTK